MLHMKCLLLDLWKPIPWKWLLPKKEFCLRPEKQGEGGVMKSVSPSAGSLETQGFWGERESDKVRSLDWMWFCGGICGGPLTAD